MKTSTIKQTINKLFRALQAQEYTMLDTMSLYIFCQDYMPEVTDMNLPDSFYTQFTEFYNKNN